MHQIVFAHKKCTEMMIKNHVKRIYIKNLYEKF